MKLTYNSDDDLDSYFPAFERPTALDLFVEASMRAEMQRQEEFLRTNALPLIAQGYRFNEISLGIERKWKHPSEDVLSIRILKQLSPKQLARRRAWRKIFPYKIPQARTKV